MYPDVARAARRQSPVTLVSAFEAITAMLTGPGRQVDHLATSFPDRVTAAEAAMFGHCGITVTGWPGLDLNDGYDTVIREQVRKIDPGGRLCCDR